MIRIRQTFTVTVEAVDVSNSSTVTPQEIHKRLDGRIASDIREILTNELGPNGVQVAVTPTTALLVNDVETAEPQQ